MAAYGTSLEVLKKMHFETGRGVVGWVAQYVQPVKVDNPKTDTRFHGSIDTATGFQSRSIIAAPILSKGKPIGIIEFLNRQGGPFAIPDLELISMIGREIGIASENVTLIKKLGEARAFQESIINSLSAGVLVLDRDDRLIEVNPTTAKRILGAGLIAPSDPPRLFGAGASQLSGACRSARSSLDFRDGRDPPGTDDEDQRPPRGDRIFLRADQGSPGGEVGHRPPFPRHHPIRICFDGSEEAVVSPLRSFCCITRFGRGIS